MWKRSTPNVLRWIEYVYFVKSGLRHSLRINSKNYGKSKSWPTTRRPDDPTADVFEVGSKYYVKTKSRPLCLRWGQKCCLHEIIPLRINWKKLRETEVLTTRRTWAWGGLKINDLPSALRWTFVGSKCYVKTKSRRLWGGAINITWNRAFAILWVWVMEKITWKRSLDEFQVRIKIIHDRKNYVK